MKAEIKPIKIGVISDDCKFKLPLTRSLPIFPKINGTTIKKENLAALVLSTPNKTEVEIVIRDKDKTFAFKLEKPRKFDLNIFNNVKNKQYVKKISF